MENKYYTPSIEDIRVGYQCEINKSLFNGISEGWHKFVFVDFEQLDVINFNGLKALRTPYLTKEQIEAEGWEVSDHITGVWAEYKHFTLRYELKTHRLEVVNINQDHCVYDGMCPSINEFRQLIKLLTF